MVNWSPPARHVACCLYALYVHSGGSGFCQTVKLNTVRNYVNDMASLVAKRLVGVDIRKDNPTDKHFGKKLTTVYKEIERYEGVPKRQEPYTVSMLQEASRRAEKTDDWLGEDAAMFDWMVFGLNGGFRRCEWCQPSDFFGDPKYVQKNLFGDTMAFILADLEIQIDDKTIVAGYAMAYVSDEQAMYLWLIHRAQKNGCHGERRMYAKNTDPKGFCMIKATLRIVRRFVHLVGTKDKTTPLAVFRNQYKKPVLITSRHVETHMRAAAAAVYNLNPKSKKDQLALRKWSSHSLRVGACVILHTQDFTTSQIKWLLRWRSDSFMIYLRNVAPLAIQHARAIDRAAAMPNFLG